MADADSMKLLYAEETGFAEDPPNPAPTLTEIRFTGESLRQETDTAVSREIRSDRQVVDLVRTGIRVSGDINYELSYGAQDWAMQYGLQSTGWSSEVTDTVGGAITAVNPDNKLTRASGSFITDGFTANSWIRITGFSSEPTNNAVAKIVSVSALEIVVSHITLQAEVGTAVSLEQGAQIVNGAFTAANFITTVIEKQYTDLATTFAYLLGCAINGMSLEVDATGILNGAINVLGSKEASDAVDGIGDGSPNSAPTNEVMNAIDDVTILWENGSSFSVTSIGWSFQNNLRARQVVGTLGAISLGSGKFQCDGTHRAFFETATVMNKYLAMTASEVAFHLDRANNEYVFDFPNIKYTSGQRVAGGENSDILADMAFQALMDATEGITMRIVRWPSS